MPFGQLIFGKIIKTVATRGKILRLKCTKMTKFYFSGGTAADLGDLTALPQIP